MFKRNVILFILSETSENQWQLFGVTCKKVMIFRFARHTNNLAGLIDFYVDILNFEVLGKFENHGSYDGVFLGKKNQNWHLEFTTSSEKAHHIFDDDDILVFYPETMSMYHQIISNIERKNVKTTIPRNPYWKTNGIQIQDSDGYNIIISKQKVT